MKSMKVKLIKEYALIIIGTVIMTAGIHFFKIPNGFATGGVSGIGTILGKSAGILTASQWITLINTLLLFVGFAFLGKTTGLRTVFCSLLYSALTIVFERLIPISAPLTDQPLLELVYAMILTSLGAAVIFNNGASSGGTDIIALILKKYSQLDVGKALLMVDFLIASCSFITFGVKAGLFSMLGLFAKAFLVDEIIDVINSCKYFVVVTDKHDEVSEYILKELHHGATVTDAVGSYTHDNKKMIHTVCKRIEAIRLRRHIKQIDPHAFIIITTTSEIIGRGFRSV
ncbi:MAG: YitT family protein [Clostridia bacterium]|nr:YitT family protein [Clostridia bacterium]